MDTGRGKAEDTALVACQVALLLRDSALRLQPCGRSPAVIDKAACLAL